MRSSSHFLRHIQMDLFPSLEEVFGTMTPVERRLIKILEMIQIDQLVDPPCVGLVGRPAIDRRTIARAFVAKAVLGLTSTRGLIHTLAGSPVLRKICGWSRPHDLPGEATFSRAFGEFAESALCQRVHELMVMEVFEGHLVGHIYRDSTAIEAPERPPSRKKGEKRKRKKPSKRVARQIGDMTIEEMVEELPRGSTWGCKINSLGHRHFWPGYKLHVDWADCGIPIACLITSASLHDSQAAVPLANLTSQRVQSLYDLMD